jgi:glyoxylase-like metal-dependent hydrolase (beta-lactamase superfamily II)
VEHKIFPIKMGLDTIYALRGEGVILIDGGDPHKIMKFKDGIEKASIKPEEIKLIVLTHGHWDHIGSAKEIKALTGAPILMHQGDMNLLDETYPSQPPGLTTWGKILNALLRLYSPFIKIPAFNIDIEAGDDEISLVEYGIQGTVIPTPGHTRGSVSLLLDSGEAFVGDLAMNMLPIRLSPGLPIYGDDIQTVIDSWRKLLDRGAKTVYPAHGKPFPAEVIREAIR